MTMTQKPRPADPTRDQEGDGFPGQEGEAYEVKSGLRPGERVVTRGAIFLGGQANND